MPAFAEMQKEGLAENVIIKGVFGFPVDNSIIKERGYGGIARHLKSLGVNTVVGAPLNQELIRELHAQGIKVYAEVGIFTGQEYWIKDPGTRPINSQGEPIAKQDWYVGLCPTQEKLRGEKLSYIKKIVEDFEIDGIWLDFIRYPCHWEVVFPILEETCFCDVCIEKFKNDAKVSFPVDLKSAKDKAGFIMGSCKLKWYDWRCEQITSFVREAKKILSDKNPRLELGLFAVPWVEGEFDNAIISIIAQDFKKLSTYIDIFSPMVYYKMCGKDKSWVGKVIRNMQDKTNKKIVPILQAEGISQIELAQDINEALLNSNSGVVIFNADTILNDDKKENTVRGIFNGFKNIDAKESSL